jgi:hypothetical protein
MHVIELIKQVPKDTEDRVKNASKRMRQGIRDGIRSETRLKLSPGAMGRRYQNARGEVSITVDELGYPEKISRMEISDENHLSAILSPWRPTLVQLKDSSLETDILLKQHTEQTYFQDVSIRAIPEIERLLPSIAQSHELAEILLQQMEGFDLVEHILSVNEDVLGVYEYRVDHNFRSSGHATEETSGITRTKIYLFWGVIGLVAISLGVSVEDLTAVVLAHELGHAYTYLGYDIDKYRWGSLNFSDSDHEVKEGLAQYYTERVLANMGDKIPGGLDAYRKLLSKQPKAYKEHLSWIEATTPEAVRNTLIHLRRCGPIERQQFGEHLFNESEIY